MVRTHCKQKGLKIFIDLEGTEKEVSHEILDVMVEDLNRLIDKYNSDAWNWREISQDLVAPFAPVTRLKKN